jgi:hypothetical protein
MSAYAPLASLAGAVRGDALRLVGETAEALRFSERAAAVVQSLGGLDEGEEVVRVAHVRALEASGRRREGENALYEARERLLRRAAKLGPHRERFLDAVPGNRVLLTLAREWLGS